ncbi:MULTISPECIES: hypothetical protein [Gammaproteobacteria]|uniref:Uncharacterized protein n=1 Tax=Klebsiella quasipneumoniae subsp. quasipneumoniae TaxID=1667327 RepID=A0AAW8XW71_9ENTR|nr:MULTISPECIES: hypothetical protein [Gammaproteobacteria]HCG2921409.1 hypothetical protein [Klebsiella pneumoniae]MBJ7582898.1 hypothetical protein [Aeromonas veronii]MDM9305889.1 hypothetical protein [Klebsiella quasipneumoniae subsp. similipneumoniae]MDV0844696.1 hypothetical protein [Klebsiella quasipneumoniae subsp. quasipneumoniae]BBG91552.1 hypothetical protein ACGSH8M1_p10070 [Aeromonas caviae]
MELNYDKEVSDAHLAAAGWGMDAFNHSNPFESHVIYVRDYRSDNTRLFTIRQDEFDVIRVPAHQPIEVMTSVIAASMIKLARGTLKINENSGLAHALVGYAKATQTYRQWRLVAGAKERLHLILNIYPTRGDDGLLRPIILRTPETVLSTTEVLMTAAQIRDVDRVNHPEWFKTKKLGGRR